MSRCYIPTEEELAEAEKRRQRLVKQREANQRYYAKRKALASGDIPEPTPEELAAAEQAEQAKQAERLERRRATARDWARKNRAKKSTVMLETA